MKWNYAMLGQPGTRSELISIPQDAWASRANSVAPAEVAASALAIERRQWNRVGLPNELSRYAAICDRLADIARELADEGTATRVWAADRATTARWAALSFTLVDRLRSSTRMSKYDPPLLLRAFSTFIPPDRAGAVAACLDLLLQEEASQWPDGADVLPLLEARANVCRNAAAHDHGLIEVLVFR
jgi:hypothetical protein